MSSVFPPNRPAPAKPCQRCGAPLPTNELTCRNCGYQHMPTRSNTGQLHAAWGKFLPPESGPDQSWHPAMPTSAFPQLSFPQQGLPRQQESFSRGATGNARPLTGQLAGPGQQPRPPFSGPPSFPQQPTPSQQLRPGGPPPFPHQPPFNGPTSGRFPPNERFGSSPEIASPPARKRNGKPLLIFLAVLVIVILIGGSWWGYGYFTAQNNAQNPQTSPAATFVPKKPPLFADSFKDNTNGWSTISQTGKFSASVGNGALTLENNDHKMLWEAVPNKTKDKTRAYGDFNDFKLLVDITLTKGDQNNGYGLLFRSVIGQNGEMTSYYRFGLYSDGTYAIFKGSTDASGKTTQTTLVDYKSNSIIQAGNKPNHLSITAKGSTMTFVVNGQTLETINDNSYKGGVIALFVINLQTAQGGAQARFTNLGIYPPDA